MTTLLIFAIDENFLFWYRIIPVAQKAVLQAQHTCQDNNYVTCEYITTSREIVCCHISKYMLSLKRPCFDFIAVLVGFVVDEVAPGQVFLRVLSISPLKIIPVFHTHSFNHSFIHLSVYHERYINLATDFLKHT